MKIAAAAASCCAQPARVAPQLWNCRKWAHSWIATASLDASDSQVTALSSSTCTAMPYWKEKAASRTVVMVPVGSRVTLALGQRLAIGA